VIAHVFLGHSPILNRYIQLLDHIWRYHNV